MAKGSEKRGLGRGLSALMADIQPNPPAPVAGSDASSSGRLADLSVPVERLSPNPDQPRRTFEPEQLGELAASIKAKGILQPLIVRPDPADSTRFQIVAGERRWRAAQLAQLHEVPVLVRHFDDTEVLEVAIIENIQRADLNPLEEAQGYRHLMDRFGHTQEQLAQEMGKSRSHLANAMRLLQLPDEIQHMLREGKLTAGHARALITATDPVALARLTVAKGLSVRDVEAAAKKGPTATGRSKTTTRASKDADTRMLESDLSAALGMGVVIDHDSKGGGGKLSIKYKDLNQLDDLMRLLSTT